MLKEKNESLLNELSSATAAKQRVQRTRKWTFFFFLVMSVAFYFSENVYARLVTTLLAIGMSALHYRVKQIANKVNLKEKFSTGKRAGDEVSRPAQSAEELFVASSKTLPASTVSSKPSTTPKVTTLSPFKGSHGRASLFSSREEAQSSFDPLAAERLLAEEREREEKEELMFHDAVSEPTTAGARPLSMPAHSMRARLNASNLFAGGPGMASTAAAAAAPSRPFYSSSSSAGVGPFAQQSAMERERARERERSRAAGHHVYHLSPMHTGPRGAQPGSRVKDALQALELRQLPEIWIDRLREILGKDLTRIMNLYEESIGEMMNLLKFANLPPHDLQKALLLLEFRSPSGREVLANKSTVSIEDVVTYARSLGLSAIALHKFEQTVSFMQLCQWIVQLRLKEQEIAAMASRSATQRESYASQFFPSIFTSAASASAHVSASSVVGDRERKSTLIDRLRVLAQDSSDFGLRVHWSPTDLHEVVLQGRVEHEILDQEVALALFLHRCDSTVSLRALSPSLSADRPKFSHTHLSLSLHDLQTRVRPSLSTLQESTLGSVDVMHTMLLQRCGNSSLSDTRFAAENTLYPSMSESLSTSNTPSFSPLFSAPHYDVVRVNSLTGAIEEILSIDISRQDVFEALLVFMLVVFLAHSPEVEGETAEVDAQLCVDFRVVHPLIEEIVGREELRRVLLHQRQAVLIRCEEEERRVLAQSEKVVSSGFGFGSPSVPSLSPSSSAYYAHSAATSAHFATVSSSSRQSPGSQYTGGKTSSSSAANTTAYLPRGLRSSRMFPSEPVREQRHEHTPMSVSPGLRQRERENERDLSSFDINRAGALDGSVAYTQNFSRYYNPTVDFATPR